MGGVREEGASGKEEGCGALLGGVEWVHEKVRWRGSRGGDPGPGGICRLVPSRLQLLKTWVRSPRRLSPPLQAWYKVLTCG